jgi:hypothetical protein
VRGVGICAEERENISREGIEAYAEPGDGPCGHLTDLRGRPLSIMFSRTGPAEIPVIVATSRSQTVLSCGNAVR